MAASKTNAIKNRSGSSSQEELNRTEDDKYNKTKKNSETFPWFRLAATSLTILGCLYLIIWFQFGTADEYEAKGLKYFLSFSRNEKRDSGTKEGIKSLQKRRRI